MKTFAYALICLSFLLTANLAQADVEMVDSEKLESMIAEGAVIIDIRREDEWRNTGIIENSHTATFFDQYGAFNTDKWMEQVSPLLNNEQPVVLICHGGVRSNWVAKWLDSNADIGTIYDATEGVAGWVGKGKPTQSY